MSSSLISPKLAVIWNTDPQVLTSRPKMEGSRFTLGKKNKVLFHGPAQIFNMISIVKLQERLWFATFPKSTGSHFCSIHYHLSKLTASM